MSNGTGQFAQELPVIYLAFANPQGDLRGIAKEYNDIVDTLESAEKQGLCKFVPRPLLLKQKS